ncbi:MAG: KAP family NTPase, partial [Alphaproteobacteria bacterium]|nr:KAP family NTPase [Alphaproteobacteria bacterium]
MVQLSKRDGAIGLEGQWGSGKSTVINLANNQLMARSDTEDQKFLLFTFDLWEHQSDDFRRAFLEEFVNWLQRNKHLEPRAAESAKNKIRDKIKEVETLNQKSYSFFGAVLLIFTPLAPILYSWLTPAGAKADIRLFNVEAPYFFLAIISLIYAGFLWRTGYHFFKIEKDENGNPIGFPWNQKFSQAVSKSVSMFSKNVEKEAVTQNVRESDPTTIEFHAIFRDLLSKVQQNEKRLIFVLDNIDRLPKNHVPDIWSEVRSLFSNLAYKDPQKNAWVTAVIPYDKTFIQECFEITAKDNSSGKLEGDIFSKTFCVTLHVSPPISTAWEKFLEQRLNEAFNPALEPETIFRLFSLLKLHFQKKSMHPTPRQIVAYVNDVGSLWLQWENIISLESIALYSLHRAKIESIPGALLNTDFVEAQFLRTANVKEWQKDFAALIFNVHPDMAYQVLLLSPLVLALSEGNKERLVKLSESQGFSGVLLEALEISLGNSGIDPVFISKIATGMQAVNLEGELGRTAWRRMGYGVQNIGKFDLTNIDAIEGIFTIAQLQEGELFFDVTSGLRRMFANSFVSLQKGHAFDEGVNWAKAIAKTADIIGTSQGSDARMKFLKETNIPDNGEFFVGVAYSCSEMESINLSELTRKTHKKNIFQEFTNDYLKYDGGAIIFNKTLMQMKNLWEDNYRSGLLDIIGSGLSDLDVKTSDDIRALLELYAELYFDAANTSVFQPNLSHLVNDRTLVWR